MKYWLTGKKWDSLEIAEKIYAIIDKGWFGDDMWLNPKSGEVTVGKKPSKFAVVVYDSALDSGRVDDRLFELWLQEYPEKREEFDPEVLDDGWQIQAIADSLDGDKLERVDYSDMRLERLIDRRNRRYNAEQTTLQKNCPSGEDMTPILKYCVDVFKSNVNNPFKQAEIVRVADWKVWRDLNNARLDGVRSWNRLYQIARQAWFEN